MTSLLHLHLTFEDLVRILSLGGAAGVMSFLDPLEGTEIMLLMGLIFQAYVEERNRLFSTQGLIAPEFFSLPHHSEGCYLCDCNSSFKTIACSLLVVSSCFSSSACCLRIHT